MVVACRIFSQICLKMFLVFLLSANVFAENLLCVNEQTIELGETKERHVPVEVWRNGICKTSIILEGNCTSNNAFELYMGIDFNKDRHLEYDGSEMFFRFGWDNMGVMLSKVGHKKVTVDFNVDENGKLVTCIWGENGKLGKYENGDETDVMFNRDWNLMYLRESGKSTNGKVIIRMFKSGEGANSEHHHVPTTY